MPQLKVCGITDAAFAVEAARRGVDYLGFIFAKGSPRLVSAEKARAIAEAVRAAAPRRPRFVGVFVGTPANEAANIASSAGLDVVQLHGGYDADDGRTVKARGFEVWRLLEGDADTGNAGEDAILVDGRDGSRSGGTGRLADWSAVGRLKGAGRRVVLAGGISPANIRAAVATGADIIDVNSGIETAPGTKSAALLAALLEAFIC
ncbi:MAG: phosphoribosylanthranilate isomerase [Kiritimatiellae bacterium]|nr:phosphoribosylanthranilate isomerase [Kiritimatiellia bacterium]